MKQYAVVKDHISGELFGVVVREGITETCYGLSAKGEAWADAYNGLSTKSLQDELPYGIEVGDFRGMSNVEEILIADMIDGNKDVRLPNREAMVHVGSARVKSESATPELSGAPLSFFADDRFQNVVEYKVRAFLNESARSSVMVKVRLERLGVEAKGMKFKSRNGDEFLSEDLERIANGPGVLRRTVKDVFSAKSEVLAGHDGYSLSPFEPEVKAIGPKLGGGLRAAPRGMSFVDITGRVDGDSDGIVFEGVPGMERPIIPRFMVPKNMARRISALVDGDSMEIEKQRRAGNARAAIDEGRLQELLGDQANVIRRLDGQGLQSRRGRRRTEDYPRMDPEVVERLRAERFVPETSPSGRARQSRVINTPTSDGGPPRRAVRERSGRVIPEPPARRVGGDFDLNMARMKPRSFGLTAADFGLKSRRERMKRVGDFIRGLEGDNLDEVIDGLTDRVTDRVAEQVDKGIDRLPLPEGVRKQLKDRSRASMRDLVSGGMRSSRAEESFDNFGKEWASQFKIDLDSLIDNDNRKRPRPIGSDLPFNLSDGTPRQMFDESDEDFAKRNPFSGWDLSTLVDKEVWGDGKFRGMQSNRRADAFFELNRDERRALLDMPENERQAALDDMARRNRAETFFGLNREERREMLALSPEERGRRLDDMRRESRAASRAEADGMRSSREDMKSRSTGNPVQPDEVLAELSDDEYELVQEMIGAVRKRILDSQPEGSPGYMDDRAVDGLNSISSAAEAAYRTQTPMRISERNLERAADSLDRYLEDLDGLDMDAEDTRGLIGTLLDAHAQDDAYRSFNLDDQGMRSTRLSRGDGQVRRDERGNIIPEENIRQKLDERRNERLRELGFDDEQIAQLTGGLRSRRSIDDMTDDELQKGQTATIKRANELIEEIGVDGFSLRLLDSRPQDREQWVRDNYDGDLGEGMALFDELDRQRALHRDIVGRRAERRRIAQEAERREGHKRAARGMAEKSGTNPEQAEQVIDEIIMKMNPFDDEFPGEVVDNYGDYNPLNRRTGWGARINNETEAVDGVINDGPLAGTEYQFSRSQTWADSTYHDPSELLGGHHSLYVHTPDGNIYEFQADIEDDLSLVAISKPSGMKSKRPTGDEAMDFLRRVDGAYGGYGRIGDDLASNMWTARDILNGIPPKYSDGETAKWLRSAIRDLRSGDGYSDLKAEDAKKMEEYLQHAIDQLMDNRAGSMGGMRSKKQKKQVRQEPRIQRGAPDAVPEFTDTSIDEVLRHSGLTVINGLPGLMHPDDRKFFKMLYENGFRFTETSDTGSKIVIPDRLFIWTMQQNPQRVQMWSAATRTEFKPGQGIVGRPTHFKKDARLQGPIESWLKAIFGRDAVKDLERNARNKGVGKVGDVPSAGEVRQSEIARRADMFSNGMRSARGSDRGLPQRDRRSAQMDVTATRGLGGGMRARKRRGVAGQTKVTDTDGQAWSKLTPEQQSSVIEAARAREGGLFWDITRQPPLRGARQNMLDDGLWTDDMSDADRKAVFPPGDLLVSMQAKLDSALRDGDITIEKHAELQKKLDDIKTLQQMRADDDYSLLEHLHDTTQKRVVGDARKANKDVPTAASLGLGKESTFYSAERQATVGRQGKDVTERAAKRKGKRRIALVDRILQPDPERAQRRQNRRMRRAGQSGRRATEADVSATQTARRKLARLLRRARRKLRGKRDEGTIRKEYESRRKKLPLSRAADGTPIVDDKFVDFAGFINAQILKRQSGEISAKTQDDVLLNLWENGEMNGSPVLLDQDEFQALIDAGWTPIHRGMGRGKDTQGYVDSYKEDSDRFIPAQGGRAYGVGEYWATQRGGHWGHYGDGVVGFIDPDGVKKTAAEMSAIKSDHQKFANPIDDLMREVGEDALKLEDPANAVTQIRKRLDETEKRLGTAGLLEQSDMGRIYDQWLDMYAKMKPDDPRREKMWDALMYMQKMRKYDEGYYAPLLGIDYIDHGGVILVHNRGTVALLDLPEAINGNQADIIVNAAKGQ